MASRARPAVVGRVISSDSVSTRSLSSSSSSSAISKPLNQANHEVYVDAHALEYRKRRQHKQFEPPNWLYHNPLLSAKVRKYRREIRACTSISAVHAMLTDFSDSVSKSELSVICDDIMKKFISLQSRNECIHILELMYKHGIPRTIATYNILFDSLVSFDETRKAMDMYYQQMLVNEDFVRNPELRPNIITANTLLSGCKYQADIELAKQIYSDIVVEHSIQINVVTYILLITIYGRAGLSDHCYALFTDMVTQQGIAPNTGVCGALLNAFAIKGEIEQCAQIMTYMQRHQIAINVVEYCSFMKCCLVAQQPLTALTVYENVIRPMFDSPTATAQIEDKTINIVAGIRVSCYLELIQQIVGKTSSLQEHDIALIEQYKQMIMREIPFELKVRRASGNENFYQYLDRILLHKMLHTLVFLNEHSDKLKHDYEHELLPFLENGFRNHQFGYWNANMKNVLDFHLFSVANCVFVLRYFLSFKRKYIADVLKYNVRIIVGAGDHSAVRMRRDRKAKLKKNEDREDEEQKSMIPIANAIWKQLSDLEVPIKITKTQNDSIFVLNPDDLKTYFEHTKDKTPWFKSRKTI